MKVLLTGGTGTLGHHLAEQAVEAGHSVRVMSRRDPPPQSAFGWAKADLETGEGLDEAVRGIDVVLHAATSPRRRSRRVDLEGTQRLVRSAHAAGVRQIVYPSIVGVERVPFPYYRVKLEAERAIESGPVPHTILRATQFHSFIDGLLRGVSRVPFAMPIPKDVVVQSVDSSEVATHLIGLLEQGPLGRVPDFCGPEVKGLGEAAEVWLTHAGLRRRIIGVPVPGATARAFQEGRHTNPDRGVGRVSWNDWLVARSGEP